MKLFTNKTFDINTSILHQSAETKEVKVYKVIVGTTPLNTLLEPVLRELNPQAVSDLKLMKTRQGAIDVLEELTPNQELYIEDAIMDTIIQALKDFKCGFVCKGFIAMKEYIDELEKLPSIKLENLKTE